MNNVFYGLGNKQIAVMMAREICNVLGHGSNGTAKHLLVETTQQETLLGSFRDKNVYRHGVGICQFDLIGFQDVQERTRSDVNSKIYQFFGIKLRDVQHRDLAHSPFLSMLFCRLFYKLRPDPIPRTIQGRAEYWKRFYNTEKGKGTVEEYVEHQKLIEVNYL